ncbi:hypothetical protein OS493_035834 [Desmophyllum pertusum]|uniref:Uncharacterized protein n=1 Tax=Desmophyllum pertusum TaxID=174260 RepID=A0A9W9Y7H4_9CNID|nr:hypothetical protein OS493_035834 [Desmophyllum pertusum]
MNSKNEHICEDWLTCDSDCDDECGDDRGVCSQQEEYTGSCDCGSSYNDHGVSCYISSIDLELCSYCYDEKKELPKNEDMKIKFLSGNAKVGDIKVGDILLRYPHFIECLCREDEMLAMGRFYDINHEFTFWRINAITDDGIELDKLKVDYEYVISKKFQLKNGEPLWVKKAEVRLSKVEYSITMIKDYYFDCFHELYDPNRCYTAPLAPGDMVLKKVSGIRDKVEYSGSIPKDYNPKISLTMGDSDYDPNYNPKISLTMGDSDYDPMRIHMAI